MNLMMIPGLFGLLIYIAIVLCDASLKLASLWMLLIVLRLIRARYALRGRTVTLLDLQSISVFIVNVVVAWARGWPRLVALILLVLILIPTAISLRKRSEALATLLKEEKSHDFINAFYSSHNDPDAYR